MPQLRVLRPRQLEEPTFERLVRGDWETKTKKYGMPPYFQPLLDEDPGKHGLRLSHGCGFHDSVPEKCRALERHHHKSICLNQRSFLASLKEDSHKRLQALDLADRTSRKRGCGSGNIQKEKTVKKVRFETDQLTGGAPSPLSADLHFDRKALSVRSRERRVVGFVGRQNTQMLYICPRERDCLCTPRDLFPSTEAHDAFVERTRYRCGDKSCPCDRECVARSREDHEEDIKSKWVCDAVVVGDLSAKKMKKKQKKAGDGFGCLCPCRNLGQEKFRSREDHNSRILKYMYEHGIVDLYEEDKQKEEDEKRILSPEEEERRYDIEAKGFGKPLRFILDPDGSNHLRALKEVERKRQLALEARRLRLARDAWTPGHDLEFMCTKAGCLCVHRKPTRIFYSKTVHNMVVGEVRYLCTLNGCACSKETIYHTKEMHESDVELRLLVNAFLDKIED